MRNNIWQKSILILIPLFLVLSLVNIVGAGMGSRSDHDSAITSRVENKFQDDSQLMGSRIIVETKDGEVTLKGTVNSQADVTRAGKLAGYVDGVKRVDNRLKTVNSPQYGVTAPKPNCQIGANWSC
jgi:hypothetical protein